MSDGQTEAARYNRKVDDGKPRRQYSVIVVELRNVMKILKLREYPRLRATKNKLMCELIDHPEYTPGDGSLSCLPPPVRK